jgi:hypothetical protein
VDFYRKARLQNNPLMFRFLARVGMATSEAEAISSESSTPQRELSIADRLFPNLPSARK